jgi:eukaryotic-like serine/threonine-protein kinase
MPTCSTCGTQYGATVRICVRDGTPLVAGRADDPYLGRLLDDKYRIDSFISAGGMGSVYRAQHVMLGKTVAVKVIKNELVTSDEIVSRFQREARAASNLDHPNIVTVYDLGQTREGTLYIAMEFIDGPSLHDAIRRDGPMPAARAVDILRQVASALSAAHRRQIVHRDLKSHNLMLATDDEGRDLVKLVDFGIAKTFDESTQLTAAGYMMGTPHYMSPEQAAGQAVDHRTDIYSLGVILYEMLTGAVPFSDESLTSVLVKLATEVPPRPSLRRPDLVVPPALEAVAMRCLEKNPDDRYQSADEFATAIEHAGIDDGIPREAVVVPAAGATLVRPPAIPGRRPAPAPPVGDGVPAARPRSGLSMPGQIDRRVAVVLVVIAAIGAAIASGVALSDDSTNADPGPSPSRPVATVPAPSATPAVPPAAEQAAERVGVPEPPVDDANRLAETLPDGARRAPAGGVPTAARGNAPRSGVAGEGERVPGVGQVRPFDDGQGGRSGSRAARSGGADEDVASAARERTPAAAREQIAAAPPQVSAASPSVYLACKGFPDVCSVIRAEMTRGFQRDGVTVAVDRGPADVGVTAVVTLVSETASADFGTPMLTRTYSVELTSDSRGTAVAMPEPRRFSYDARVGSERLAENARLIAAGAVESVRAYLTRSRP